MHNETFINMEEEKTYDVVFEDSEKGDSEGFHASLEYCHNYIDMWNGTDHSYFPDYKRGAVQIICNETGDVVYEEDIK